MEIKYGVVPIDEFKNAPAIEVFQKMIDGKLPAPPIARPFDFLLTEISHGRAVFSGRPTENFLNPLGTVHGGYIATLLDSAMACAVHSTQPAGKGSTSIELKINFIRPVPINKGVFRAEGNLISIGRQIGVADGKLIDESGKVFAHGTTTCMIFDL